MTNRHGKVHTVAELQRACGYFDLEQSRGFPFNRLHSRLRGLKVKLNGPFSLEFARMALTWR